MDRHRADGGGCRVNHGKRARGWFTIFWCDVLTSDDHTLIHSEPHTHCSVCVSEADLKTYDFDHTKADIL